MKAVLKTGKVIQMTADQGQRVLYAITTLAASPVGQHLNVERIEDANGVEVWPCVRPVNSKK